MDSKDPGPRDLMAKALEMLEPAERRQVTAWLVERSFRTPRTGHSIGIAAGIAEETRERLLESAMAGARRGEHQVVPIRLPTAQHAALRDWCTEHGFTMATVVRGLVERFLEDQGQLPGRAA